MRVGELTLCFKNHKFNKQQLLNHLKFVRHFDLFFFCLFTTKHDDNFKIFLNFYIFHIFL